MVSAEGFCDEYINPGYANTVAGGERRDCTGPRAGDQQTVEKLQKEITTATVHVGNVESHNLFANLYLDFARSCTCVAPQYKPFQPLDNPEKEGGLPDNVRKEAVRYICRAQRRPGPDF